MKKKHTRKFKEKKYVNFNKNTHNFSQENKKSPKKLTKSRHSIKNNAINDSLAKQETKPNKSV